MACDQGSARPSSAAVGGDVERQSDGGSDTESEDEKDLRALAVHARVPAVSRSPAARQRKPAAPLACAASLAPAARPAPLPSAAQPCATKTATAQLRRVKVDLDQACAAKPSAKAQPCVPKRGVLQTGVSAKGVSEKRDGPRSNTAHPTSAVAAPERVRPASPDRAVACAPALLSADVHVRKPESGGTAAKVGRPLRPAPGTASVANGSVNGAGGAPDRAPVSKAAAASTACAPCSAADTARPVPAVHKGSLSLLSAAPQKRTPQPGHREVPKRSPPATACKSTGATASTVAVPSAAGAAVSAKHGVAQAQKSRGAPSAAPRQAHFNPCKRRPPQPATAPDAATPAPSSGKPGGGMCHGPSTKTVTTRRSDAMDKRPLRDTPAQDAASSMVRPYCFGHKRSFPSRMSHSIPAFAQMALLLLRARAACSRTACDSESRSVMAQVRCRRSRAASVQCPARLVAREASKPSQLQV